MNRGTAVFGALWVLTAAGAVAMVVTVSTLLAALGASQGLSWMMVILSADALAYSTMGLLIARRRPGDRVARVLSAAGALIVLTFLGFAVGARGYALNGSDDPLGGLAALVGSTALGPTLFVAIPLLAIVFPDGQLPSPRWRLPLAATVAAMIVMGTVGLVQPGPVNSELPDNPLGVESEAVVALGTLVEPLLPLGILAGVLMAIAAVATRFRRSRGFERQQVKWFLGAVTLIALFVPLSFVDTFLDASGGFTVLDVLAMSSLMLLPVSVAIAILRYRLYEIDRLISRTVSWAVVTGILVAVFALGVVGMQAVLTGFTQGQTIAVAASTLVAFALFQPLRRRVQRAVDRRFDRARYDAEGTAAAFAERLRDEVDLDTLATEIGRVVTETVRPTSAAVWLRSVADRAGTGGS